MNQKMRVLSKRCAILPDWHSATFRRSTNWRDNALTTEKCLKGGSKYCGSFNFLKFRLTSEYFSEIRKTAILTEKGEKIRTTANIVKNSCTSTRESEASYRDNHAR